MFDLDLFRSDSLATWFDDLESTPDLHFQKRYDKGTSATVSEVALSPLPAGVARQHSLALIGDSLSNYIESHVDDKDKSKLKLVGLSKC